MQDYRIFSDHELQNEVKNLAAKTKAIDLHMIAALVEITRRSIYLRLGYSSVKSYLEGEFHLSEDQAAKRSQVVNLTRNYPKFYEMLAAGKTHLSHLAMCAAKVTDRNAEKFLQYLPGKSKKDLLFFLARVTPEGEFMPEIEAKVELNIPCTEETMDSFERARKLVAKSWRGASNEEVLKAALEILLDRKDPMRRAKRAQARQEKKITHNDCAGATEQQRADVQAESRQTESADCAGATPTSALKNPAIPSSPPRALGAARYIPMKVRNLIYLRDGGRCTFVGENGRRCEESVSITSDHVSLFCMGGAHTPDNLRTMCFSHNNLLAIEALGRGKMSQYIKRIREGGANPPSS